MLSNRAVPIYYGKFRDSVLRGEIPVCNTISMQMNRIDFLISSPDYYYDDEAINGFIDFCEKEMTLTTGDPVVMLNSFKLWAEDLLAWFYYVEEKYYDQRLRKFRYRKVLRRLVKLNDPPKMVHRSTVGHNTEYVTSSSFAREQGNTVRLVISNVLLNTYYHGTMSGEGSSGGFFLD